MMFQQKSFELSFPLFELPTFAERKRKGYRGDRIEDCSTKSTTVGFRVIHMNNEVSEESFFTTSCFRDFRLRTKQFEDIGHCLEILHRLDKIHTLEISIDDYCVKEKRESQKMSLTSTEIWNETLPMINSTRIAPLLISHPVLMSKRHVTFAAQVVLTLVYITGVIGNISALVILFHRDKVIIKEKNLLHRVTFLKNKRK